MSDTPTTNGHTTVTPGQLPERIPTDIPSLAQLIHDMPDGPPSTPEGDLWDRLYKQEGYEKASALWHAACAMLDHAAEEQALLETLRTVFDVAAGAVDRIASLQKRLAEVGNIEYLEGRGVDAAMMIRRVGLDLRAACALHRQAVQP